MKTRDITAKIASKFDGREWIKTDADDNICKARVYLRKGYCEVTERGVNIDAVNRNQFDDVKDFVSSLGIETYRA